MATCYGLGSKCAVKFHSSLRVACTRETKSAFPGICCSTCLDKGSVLLRLRSPTLERTFVSKSEAHFLGPNHVGVTEFASWSGDPYEIAIRKVREKYPRFFLLLAFVSRFTSENRANILLLLSNRADFVAHVQMRGKPIQACTTPRHAFRHQISTSAGILSRESQLMSEFRSEMILEHGVAILIGEGMALKAIMHGAQHCAKTINLTPKCLLLPHI